jgi:hypothetical protein
MPGGQPNPYAVHGLDLQTSPHGTRCRPVQLPPPLPPPQPVPPGPPLLVLRRRGCPPCRRRLGLPLKRRA